MQSPKAHHPRQVARIKQVFHILAKAIFEDDEAGLENATKTINEHAKPHEEAAKLAHPNRFKQFIERVLG